MIPAVGVAQRSRAVLRVGQNSGNGFNTSTSVAQPSNVASGDVGVAVVGMNSIASVTTPTGWTLLYTGSYYRVWYKVYGASEPSVSVTFGFGTSYALGVAVYRRVNNTTPVQSSTPTAFVNGASSETTASLTPSTSGTRLLSVLAGNFNASGVVLTAPSGMLQLINSTNASCGIGIAETTQVANGSSTINPSWGSSKTALSGTVAMILLGP